MTALRQPPSVFTPTFSVGGGGPPRAPLTPYPVRPVRGELDRVELRDHVRPEVLRCVDLVQQLRGDGVDGDRAAGTGVFGDDADPSAWNSAIGKPGRRPPSGSSVKNA